MADCGSWLETNISAGVAAWLNSSKEVNKTVYTDDFELDADHSNLHIRHRLRLERIIDILDIQHQNGNEIRVLGADEECKIELVLPGNLNLQRTSIGSRIGLTDFRIRISSCYEPPKIELLVRSFRVLSDHFVDEDISKSLSFVKDMPLVARALDELAEYDEDASGMDSPRSLKSQEPLLQNSADGNSDSDNMNQNFSSQMEFVTQAPLFLPSSALNATTLSADTDIPQNLLPSHSRCFSNPPQNRSSHMTPISGDSLDVSWDSYSNDLLNMIQRRVILPEELHKTSTNNDLHDTAAKDVENLSKSNLQIQGSYPETSTPTVAVHPPAIESETTVNRPAANEDEEGHDVLCERLLPTDGMVDAECIQSSNEQQSSIRHDQAEEVDNLPEESSTDPGCSIQMLPLNTSTDSRPPEFRALTSGSGKGVEVSHQNDSTSLKPDLVDDPFAQWRRAAVRGRYVPRYAARIEKEQQEILSTDAAWQPALIGKPHRLGTIPASLEQKLLHKVTLHQSTLMDTDQVSQKDDVEGDKPDAIVGGTINEHISKPGPTNELYSSQPVSSALWPQTPIRNPRQRGLPPDSPLDADTEAPDAEVAVVGGESVMVDIGFDDKSYKSPTGTEDAGSDQLQSQADRTRTGYGPSQAERTHTGKLTRLDHGPRNDPPGSPESSFSSPRESGSGEEDAVQVHRTPFSARRNGNNILVETSIHASAPPFADNSDVQTPTATFIPASFGSGVSPQTQEPFASNLQLGGESAEWSADNVSGKSPLGQQAIEDQDETSYHGRDSLELQSTIKVVTPSGQGHASQRSTPDEVLEDTEMQHKRVNPDDAMEGTSGKRQKLDNSWTIGHHESAQIHNSDYRAVEQDLREFRRAVLRPISKDKTRRSLATIPRLPDDELRDAAAAKSASTTSKAHLSSAVDTDSRQIIPDTNDVAMQTSVYNGRAAEADRDAGDGQAPVARNFSVDEVFVKFCQSYPDYRGQKSNFIEACDVLQGLREEGTAPHRSLFDDAIYHYFHTFKDDSKNGWGDYGAPMPFHKYYEAYVEEPTHLLRIVRPEYLTANHSVPEENGSHHCDTEIELGSNNRHDSFRSAKSQTFSFERSSGAESPELGARVPDNDAEMPGLDLQRTEHSSSHRYNTPIEFDPKGKAQKKTKKRGSGLLEALKPSTTAQALGVLDTRPRSSRFSLSVASLKGILPKSGKSKHVFDRREGVSRLDVFTFTK